MSIYYDDQELVISMGEIEVVCWFWVPGKEEKKFPGLLRFNPRDGASLRPSKNCFLGEKIDTIYASEGIRKFSLLDCYFITDKEEYVSSWLFISDDYHVATKTDILFDSIEFSFRYLGDWMNFDALAFALGEYNLPEDVERELEDGTKIKICFSYPTSSEGFLWKGDVNANIIATFKKSKNLSNALSFVGNWHALICLGIGHPTELTYLEGSISDSTNKMRIYRTGLFFPSKYYRDKKSEMPVRIYPHEMFFTFNSINGIDGLVNVLNKPKLRINKLGVVAYQICNDVTIESQFDDLYRLCISLMEVENSHPSSLVEECNPEFSHLLFSGSEEKLAEWMEELKRLRDEWRFHPPHWTSMPPCREDYIHLWRMADSMLILVVVLVIKWAHNSQSVWDVPLTAFDHLKEHPIMAEVLVHLSG